MGNAYPDGQGNFDKRNDIIEYRISYEDIDSMNGEILWRGDNKPELMRHLEINSIKYAIEWSEKTRRKEKVNKKIRVSRYFGERVPENNEQFAEYHDSYVISFWKSEEPEFNCVRDITAVRQQFGKDPIYYNFETTKCKDFTHAVFLIILEIQGKTF